MSGAWYSSTGFSSRVRLRACVRAGSTGGNGVGGKSSCAVWLMAIVLIFPSQYRTIVKIIPGVFFYLASEMLCI